jgi:oligopeptide transport system substrate-binding protein
LLIGLVMSSSLGCWPASDEASKAGGRGSSISLGGWPSVELDPARADDPATVQQVRLVFSGLMSYDSAMRLQPDLAADFPVSRNGITYTFTLRANAQFHDGRRVVADDIKYSIERACKPDPALAATLLPCARSLGEIKGVADELAGRSDAISGLRVIDDLHLSIVLTDSDVAFPYRLAEPVAFVVDRDQVRSDPGWMQHPNGSGPYLVQRRDEQGLTLARFSDYYGPAPALDYIQFPDSGNAQDDYAAGRLDIARVESVAKGDQVRYSPGLRLTYWGLNNRLKPFDDPLVRQAFARALDVDAMQAVGSAAAYGLLPLAFGGESSAQFDLSAARQLLAQSSYKSAANLPPIVVYTSNDPFAARVSAAISANLGLDISVRNVEYSDLIANYASYQSFIADFQPPAAEPGTLLAALLRSDSAANLSGYSNAAVDERLDALASADDLQARAALVRQIVTLADDAPLLPLAWQSQTFLIKPYVQGPTLTPWGLDLSKTQIAGR